MYIYKHIAVLLFAGVLHHWAPHPSKDIPTLIGVSTFVGLFTFVDRSCRNHSLLHQFLQAFLQSLCQLLSQSLFLLQQLLMLHGIAVAAAFTCQAPPAAVAGIELLWVELQCCLLLHSTCLGAWNAQRVLRLLTSNFLHQPICLILDAILQQGLQSQSPLHWVGVNRYVQLFPPSSHCILQTTPQCKATSIAVRRLHILIRFCRHLQCKIFSRLQSLFKEDQKQSG